MKKNIFELASITVATKADAEKLLYQMAKMIQKYGVVRVCDMYDLAGITCEFITSKYGWKSCKSVYDAKIKQVHDGWQILMPVPTFL